MEANVNKSQQESVPPTGSAGHTQPVQISRVSSGPTPHDVMTMAKAIFASIAGSTPGTITERGTSLNPDDVTRALIQKGFGMTKIMEAEIKIKQVVAAANQNVEGGMRLNVFLEGMLPLIQELDSQIDAKALEKGRKEHMADAARVRPVTAPDSFERIMSPLPEQLQRPASTGLIMGVDKEIRRLHSHDVLIRQYGMQNLIARSRKGVKMDRIIDEIVERSTEEDFLMRSFAVQGLVKVAGEIRDHVVEALIARTKDADCKVRARAAGALRRACIAGKLDAIEALVEACDDDDGFVRDAATNVVQTVVLESSTFLRRTMMLCRSEGVRIAVVQASRTEIAANRKDAIDVVGSAVGDHSFHVRLEVASALCCVIDKKRAFSGTLEVQKLSPEVIGWVIKLLGDPRPEVKKILLADFKSESAFMSDKLFAAVLATTHKGGLQMQKLAVSWLADAVSTRIMLNDESTFKRMVDLMKLDSGESSTAQAAAAVVGAIICQGQNKYLKLMQPLCTHEHAGVRTNAARCLTLPALKLLPPAMYAIADMIRDENKSVKLAVLACFEQGPVGCREFSVPTMSCLEDDDDDVRYAASETLGRLLDRVDMEIKLRLVDLLMQYDDTSIPIKAGTWIGPIYRSFDVGYIGLKPKNNFQIKQAIIRTFSRMGMPLEIVAIGTDAVTACLQRHFLGFGYDLPPTFHAERAKRIALEKAQARMAANPKKSQRDLLMEHLGASDGED